MLSSNLIVGTSAFAGVSALLPVIFLLPTEGCLVGVEPNKFILNSELIVSGFITATGIVNTIIETKNALR